MSMNAEGANVWARMTSDNVGKQIAIVLDDMVYSYPNVQNAITGGSSSITGHFTPDEATDLVNVLKSGKLLHHRVPLGSRLHDFLLSGRRCRR